LALLNKIMLANLAYSISKEFRGKGLIYAPFSDALENMKLKIITV